MINIYKHGDAQDSHVSLPEGNHKFDVLPQVSYCFLVFIRVLGGSRV
jgi:hypothetical protein